MLDGLEPNLHLVSTEDQLEELVDLIHNSSRFSYDLETDSLDVLTANIVGVAIGIEQANGINGYYLPVAHEENKALISWGRLEQEFIDLVVNPEGYLSKGKGTKRKYNHDDLGILFNEVLTKSDISGVTPDVDQTLIEAFNDILYSYMDEERLGSGIVLNSFKRLLKSVLDAPQNVVYVTKPFDTNLPLELVLTVLRPYLESEDHLTIAHNAFYDNCIMRLHGVRVKNFICTLAIAYILFGGFPKSDDRRRIGLKSLVKRLFDHEMLEFKDMVKKGETFANVKPEDAFLYASDDGLQTVKLYIHLMKLYQKQLEHPLYPLKDFILDDEMVLVDVLIDAKIHGCLMDTEYIEGLDKIYNEKVIEYKKAVDDITGGAIANPNSGKQVGDYLVNVLGLEATLYTPKGAVKTNDDALALFEKQDTSGVVSVLRKLKRVAKLTTFTNNLKKFTREDGRIHGNFNAYFTETNRFSSSQPNLQNIPSRKDPVVRGCFVAPEGYSLLAVDYSGQEVRIALALSKSTEIIEQVKAGKDIHSVVASMVFGKPVEEITKKERSSAKSVTFGLLYGQTYMGLSDQLKIPHNEAKALMAQYFRQLPKFDNFIKGVERFALRNKYSPTIAGTKRYFPTIDRDDSRSLRKAVNNVIQGSASMQMRRALALIYPELKPYDAKMTLSIHDEVILEVKNDHLEAVKAIVIDCMERSYTLDCPALAEPDVADNWFTIKSDTSEPRPDLATVQEDV